MKVRCLFVVPESRPLRCAGLIIAPCLLPFQDFNVLQRSTAGLVRLYTDIATAQQRRNLQGSGGSRSSAAGGERPLVRVPHCVHVTSLLCIRHIVHRSHAPNPSVAQVAARYRLEEPIACGAFSSIYR
jgi:hypothetical protein